MCIDMFTNYPGKFCYPGILRSGTARIREVRVYMFYWGDGVHYSLKRHFIGEIDSPLKKCYIVWDCCTINHKELLDCTFKAAGNPIYSILI